MKENIKNLILKLLVIPLAALIFIIFEEFSFAVEDSLFFTGIILILFAFVYYLFHFCRKK